MSFGIIYLLVGKLLISDSAAKIKIIYNLIFNSPEGEYLTHPTSKTTDIGVLFDIVNRF